jgi:hypothetical protein
MTRRTLELEKNRYPTQFFVIIATMLHRSLIHFVLIFLFAFAQIGATMHAAEHEISHFGQGTEHNEPDNQAADKQCTQCLSFAQVAGGLPPTKLAIEPPTLACATNFFYHDSTTSHSIAAYTARAPPLFA